MSTSVRRSGLEQQNFRNGSFLHNCSHPDLPCNEHPTFVRQYLEANLSNNRTPKYSDFMNRQIKIIAL